MYNLAEEIRKIQDKQKYIDYQNKIIKTIINQYKEHLGLDSTPVIHHFELSSEKLYVYYNDIIPSDTFLIDEIGEFILESEKKIKCK